MRERSLNDKSRLLSARYGPANADERLMTFLTIDRNVPRSFWRVAAVGFAVVVAWFAFRPAADVASGLPWDKANHAVAFLVLTMLTGLGWPGLHRLWLFALMVVAGIAIELVQGLPAIGRDADVMDVLADAVGAMAGILALWLWSRRTNAG